MGWCAQGLSRGGWGHMGGWGAGGWMVGLFGLIVFVGVMGLLALGAVWLARRTRLQSAPMGASRAQPLETARHRLAAGEITPAEFEELREQLES